MYELATLLIWGFFLVSLIPLLLGIGVVFAVAKHSKPRLSGSLAVSALWLLVMYILLTKGQRERDEGERAFEVSFRPHAEYFSRACTLAGTIVHRKVVGVDSVLFQEPRTDVTAKDLWDPGFRGDVYGGMDISSYSTGGEWSLLGTFLTQPTWDNLFWPKPARDVYLRYPQVEVAATIERTPGYFRYNAVPNKAGLHFTKEFTREPSSRYAVRWEDISTSEDRKHWIAGSKWTILDIKSGEVLAERIGYAIDRAQGQRPSGPTGNAGEGLPAWARAGHKQYSMKLHPNACPQKTDLYNLEFVRSALEPVEQEVKVTHPEKP